MGIRAKAFIDTCIVFGIVLGICGFIMAMLLIGPIGILALLALLLVVMFWGIYDMSYREHELYELIDRNSVVFHKREK